MLRDIPPWPAGVELPQDPAEDLAVVAPWLATPAVGRQQRLHAREGVVGELQHRRLLELVAFQKRDAIQP
jgi:hypothetical protein